MINLDIIDLIELGESLYAEGQVNGARSRFLEALKLAPEDPQLQNRLGMLEMSVNNSKKAMDYYTEACRLAPDVSRYHMRLGDSLQRQEKFEDAIKAYAVSLELEPKNAPAWNNRGFANFNINRWNEALRCYDESMRSDPSYAVAWYNYGYTLQLSGRLNDSKDYYQKAVDLDPRDKIAWNNLANVHYNQGQYERSIEIYKKSLELDPGYVIAVNNIGNALDHLHRYEEAIPYHEQAIELDSNFHYAWMAKGRALVKLGKPEQGLEYIETSIELDNQDPDYYEALGRCYLSLNFLTKSRQIINRGLALDGQHVPCWVALGDVNLKIGDEVQALQCFDEAVRAQDMLSRNRMRDLDWIEKGRILYTSGVLHEGLRQYSNAISVAPETSRPYFRKAEVLIEYDKFDEALKLIEEGLALDPDSLSGRLLLVKSLDPDVLLNRVEELLDSPIKSQTLQVLIASKIIEHSPSKALELLEGDSQDTIFLRAQCQRNLGDLAASLSTILRALDHNSGSLDSWLMAGWNSYDLGNFEVADYYFSCAIGCDINCPDALYGKALALRSLGHDYSHYQMALKDIDDELII